MINRIRNWLADRLRIAAGRIAAPASPGNIRVWIAMTFNTADLSRDEAKEIRSAAHRYIAAMCREQACPKKIDAEFERALRS